MYGRAMPSDRFDQLWTSDWRTLAAESAGDTPEAREAQALTEDDQDTREGGNQDRELTDEEQQERDERREERRAERDAEREEEDSTDSTDTTDTTQPVTETTAG